MTTFIERMQILANDKEAVQRTYEEEYRKNKEARKDMLFKELTFKYYDEIKNAIENASKHGRQYVYMNFDRDSFKANFHGLGTPAEFQRLWLKELCDPNSKYLKGPSWGQSKFNNKTPTWGESFNNQTSVFNYNEPVINKESFEGINFDVWNNRKFTTVFSWDSNIKKNSMYHYHTSNWQTEIEVEDPNK